MSFKFWMSGAIIGQLFFVACGLFSAETCFFGLTIYTAIGLIVCKE